MQTRPSHRIGFQPPAIGEEEIEAVAETLRSGWLTTGPRAALLEERMAAYLEAEHVLALSSCTAALHLSLVVAGIAPGDEVLIPAMTFAASAAAVEHAHGTPVFVDCDPRTLLIDLDDAERRLTPRTKAIMPVHFGGLPCDMDALAAFASAHGLAIVEDAAHAIGARLDGRAIGSFDSFACFSFYPNKNLTTGEGGMVTLRDDDAAERLRMLRLHGLSTDAWKRYATHTFVPSELHALGFKYNLTDLQAAIGIHQLAKLDAMQARRNELAARYDEVLRQLPGVTLQQRTLPGHEVRHALHLYLLLLDLERFRVSRNNIVAALRAENVGAAIHYRALHLEPYYQERYGHAPDDFPNAAAVSESVLTLPLTPGMTDRDAQDVLDATAKVLAAYAR